MTGREGLPYKLFFLSDDDESTASCALRAMDRRQEDGGSSCISWDLRLSFLACSVLPAFYCFLMDSCVIIYVFHVCLLLYYISMVVLFDTYNDRNDYHYSLWAPVKARLRLFCFIYCTFRLVFLLSTDIRMDISY